LLVVKIRVVILVDTSEAFPEREMLWVNSDSLLLLVSPPLTSTEPNTYMIVIWTAVTDTNPATLLFLKIQTSGIWEEKESNQSTGETKPRNDVKGFYGADIVDLDGCVKGTKLANCGR
jgi:hypothetical protein